MRKKHLLISDYKSNSNIIQYFITNGVINEDFLLKKNKGWFEVKLFCLDFISLGTITEKMIINDIKLLSKQFVVHTICGDYEEEPLFRTYCLEKKH